MTGDDEEQRSDDLEWYRPQWVAEHLRTHDDRWDPLPEDPTDRRSYHDRFIDRQQAAAVARMTVNRVRAWAMEDARCHDYQGPWSLTVKFPNADDEPRRCTFALPWRLDAASTLSSLALPAHPRSRRKVTSS